MKRFGKLGLAAALAIASFAGAKAQDGALALRGLEGQVAALGADPAANPFELGAMQTLRAVEKTLQARYAYGLGDSALNVPLLRLPVGANRNPMPRLAGPETLSEIVKEFVADMAVARATLARAGAAADPFTLPVGDLWFDVNRNAARDKGEGALDLLGPVFLGRRGRFEAGDLADLRVRFDAADQAWLMAYTHMLSGFGHAYLAFDPTPVFARMATANAALNEAPLLPAYYDLPTVMAEVAAIKAEQERIEARFNEVRAAQKRLNDRISALRKERNKTADEAQRAALDAEMADSRDALKPLNEEQNALSRQKRIARNERRAAEAKLPGSRSGSGGRQAERFRSTADALFVLVDALKQQPDAAEVRAAMADWRAMIAENRRFWTLVEAETDNEAEWIPNARQTAALPIEIDPQLGVAWQGVLEDAAALLDGKLLTPHPLLPEGYGISLTRYEENPTPLDLMAMVHGVAFYDHVAQGPMISPQRWQSFNRLARGNGGLFSVWLN